MNKHKEISRRDAMKVAISLISGLIGTALGIPAIVYILSPALKTDQTNWIRVGSLSKIELGTPNLLKPKVTRQNGWMVEEEEVGVFVLTEDGRNYHALSNICTHLGCRVRWITDREQFLSPCHNGVFDKHGYVISGPIANNQRRETPPVFDKHGYVISGPPPRPLDEFETKIEDGNLYIQLPALKRTS